MTTPSSSGSSAYQEGKLPSRLARCPSFRNCRRESGRSALSQGALDRRLYRGGIAVVIPIQVVGVRGIREGEAEARLRAAVAPE